MSKTTSNQPSSTSSKRPRNTHGASRAISMDKLHQLKKMIRQDQDLRLLLIVSFGCLTMRISDILALRYEDVYSPGFHPVEVLRVKEQKTGKTRLIPLGGLRDLLNEFVAEGKSRLQRLDGPMFLSQRQRTPITRTSVNRLLAGYRARLNLMQISSHTCRKSTCRYLVLTKNYPLCVIQEMLQHASIVTTTRYLDLNRGDVEKAYADILL